MASASAITIENSELIIEACPVAGCRAVAARLVCVHHARLVSYDTKRRELVAWARWQRAFRKYERLGHPEVRAAGELWKLVRAEVLREIHGRCAEIPTWEFFA